MMETYCGNSCETCKLRQQLNCRDCLLGPGRPFSGWCEIAKCCREKDQNSCGNCTKRDYNCSKYAKHEDAPQRWLEKQEADAARKCILDENAPIFAKWLWLLFWLLIPYIISRILSNNLMIQWFPVFRWIGLGSQILYCLLVSSVFFSLSKLNKGYQKAGLCAVISIAVLIGSSFVPVEKQVLRFILLYIPNSILGIYARYAEWTAHSEELQGLDDSLSEKWQILWTQFRYIALGLIGTSVVSLLFPTLGMIALVVGLVALAVMEVKLWVYRYKTACCFREYITTDLQI